MPKRFMSVLAAAVVAATAALTGTGAAAASDTASDATSGTACADAPKVRVTTGAVFNDPVAGDGAAIVRQVCGLIHQAPPGSLIRVAHFVMSGAVGADFAGVLIKAHERGVKVQVIVDGDTRGATVAAQLATALGTDTSTDSWLHTCSGPMSGGTAACIGTKGQHNKFYLFSRSGRADDVVVQSSANLTDLNSSTYWNNAVTITGNKRLYRAYSAYFDDLAAERKNPDYYRVVAAGRVRAQFFPRAGTDATTDPIVESLAGVRCRTRTSISVGMSEWDTYRIAIPERLRELATQGCTVRIVAGIMDEGVERVLRSEPRIDLRVLGSGSALPGRIHSKYLLVQSSHDRWTLTGSHNYNETSLRRNDEALLRLDDRSIFDQYAANFETMWAAAPPAP
ncbi:phospholipase D-like domain-containing protein [Streptosporangium sp. KLBMP 9127]|nr:phospholipase D-like domain-containing protein [Streptosporangium sp. KLBMP 9127]